MRFVQIDFSGVERIEDFDFIGFPNATNNQMELYACIEALKQAMKIDKKSYNISSIVIHTDSRYVVDNYKKAMFLWPKTRWLSQFGRPVLNANLWKELIKYFKNINIRVDICWIKGHSKSIHNKAVDKKARISAKAAFNKPLSIVSVRRKKTEISVDVGSVEMNGQRITIRIITSEYMKVQQLWKYKYEVISKKSNFFGNVDLIFFHKFLSTGHTYRVRFNSDTRNPRIVKVFREIN